MTEQIDRSMWPARVSEEAYEPEGSHPPRSPRSDFADRSVDAGGSADDYETPSEPRRRRRLGAAVSVLKSVGRHLLPLSGLVMLVAAWHVGATLGWLDELLFSSPVEVAKSAVEYVASTDGREDLRVSATELGIGLAISVAVGVPVGLLMGWFRAFGTAMSSLVMLANSSPRVAFIPILLLWLGIGMGSKIALVVMGATVPLIVNAQSGVLQVDPTLAKVCRSYGGTRFQVFRTIVLPSALPLIIAGFRLAVGFGLVAVVVGEFYASTAGVGHALLQAGSLFQTERILALVGISALFGVFFTSLVSAVERRVLGKRPQMHSKAEV